MSRSSTRLALLLSLPLATLVMTVGCGATAATKKYARPTGQITYRGEPINRAFIYFAPLHEGMTAGGDVENGRFRALTTATPDDGILPGRYSVSILPVPVPVDPSKDPSEFDPHPPVLTRSGKSIPKRYCDVTTTPLVVEVYPSTYVLDFDLQD